MILAIDPGNKYSAYCVINETTYEPMHFDKLENDKLMDVVTGLPSTYYTAVIERVASYGMPVGREVFDTCEWIGRYTQMLIDRGIYVEYIYRMEEKQRICHDSRAKDTNIRKALIERFAKHDMKNGKGTEKDPDWFYGFSADMWAAYAVGVTWLDKQREEVEKLGVEDRVQIQAEGKGTDEAGSKPTGCNRRKKKVSS